MYKELHYYFNGTAFNKLVYKAGYDGIKDFAARSGISISYKTIKRACNDGHCTKRTYYAIACKLGERLGWLINPMGSLKAAFNTEMEHEEECRKDHYEELLKNSTLKYEEALNKNHPEEVVVCLTNDHCVSVKGKSIYWSWFDSDKIIRFYDEGVDDVEDKGNLKIAEFDKAAVLGIIRQVKE